MKSVIDTLVATTGWTGTGCTIAADTWPEFAASYLPGQLRMTFTAAGTAVKTFTADVSGYTNLAFNVVASTADASDAVADMRLKVKFWDTALTGVEYWVPLSKVFDQVKFLNTLSTVIKITFTATAAVDIFISEIIAYKDEMPYDAREALKQLIEISRDEELLQIGTLTAYIEDTEITTDADYLDKNLIFKVGSEVHQVLTANEDGEYKLGPYGDGLEMLANHTDSPMYLFIPVSHKPEEEDVFPGIKINGGFDFEPYEDIEYYSPVNDSNNVDETVRTSIKAKYHKFAFEIEGASRTNEPLEMISRILRKSLTGRDCVWINGRRHEIETDNVIKIPYGDATDIYDKIQTTIKIIVGEDIWQTETQTTALTNSLSVAPVVP